MARQMAGDRALSRTRRTIDGDDHLLSGLSGTQGTFTSTHPRFLVPCLGRAVKPNRFPFPAPAPAVIAGFRLLLRTGRASLRERVRLAVEVLGAVLMPLAWPCAWPARLDLLQPDADFPFRVGADAV